MRRETAWHEANWKRRRHVTVEGDFLMPVAPFGFRSLGQAGLDDQAAGQGAGRTIIGQPHPGNPRHQRRAVTDDGDVLHMPLTQYASSFQEASDGDDIETGPPRGVEIASSGPEATPDPPPATPSPVAQPLNRLGSDVVAELGQRRMAGVLS